MTSVSRLASLTSIKLRIASSLAWFAGSYTLFVSGWIGILEISAHRPRPIFFLANGLMGVLLCLAGYLLHKRRKMGAILAIALGAVAGVALVLGGRLLSITFVVTAAAIVLVLTSWREFRAQFEFDRAQESVFKTLADYRARLISADEAASALLRAVEGVKPSIAIELDDDLRQALERQARGRRAT